MLGSFLFLYCILTLYGTSLLYKDVEETGCDPSAGVEGVETCESSGPDVFGAMLGVAFAAQGISQVGNFVEALAAARVAAYEALEAINRKPGALREIIYKTAEDIVEDLNSSVHSKKSKKSKAPDIEGGEKEIKAILPKYEIDSSSDTGLKPKDIQGAISFKDVCFTYPTRPNDPVLKGMTFDIAPGETVAFVGPSGGGKSTVVSMVERFYDPLSGSIEYDGIDVKKMNVAHLRGLIGYVGQEPTLFATTIRGNIKYGNPDATQEQIEEAARLANAHDFICSFSDGYNTQVGDKGSQLSGGQKQRIAIARVLIGNPSVLVLDEATSALDAESELVVQDALDSIVERKKVTTIIVAHRLSTIRSADKINVIVAGAVAETGSHDELMAKDGYYRKLVDKQDGPEDDAASTPGASRVNSASDLTKLAESMAGGEKHTGVPHIEFKGVGFAYPTRPKKKVLQNFNLILEQGQTVALVGPSGGGKSTTVGLIERFYDPSEGVIEYMGHDVKSLNVGWYRDQIGYVGQEPTLFNDSIARNIAYGAPGASQTDIEEAAKQANCHDFIMEFPLGYETMVGERGTQLSGGKFVLHCLKVLDNAIASSMQANTPCCNLCRSKTTGCHRSSSC
jgi:ATP-binding cassette subfamily B (MDR/TAP) protein 1